MVDRSRSFTRAEPKGFTLIELMIVVVILGVLAAVAVLAYRIYIRRARTAEAAGLLANIKASQESYRAEFGMYCDVAAPEPGVPSSSAMRWDNAAVDARWTQLGFRPDSKHIYFQLDTIAGIPLDTNTRGWVGADIKVSTAFTNDHWFIARALGNQDDDALNSVFWITNEMSGVGWVRQTE